MTDLIQTYKELFLQAVKDANPQTNPDLVGSDYDVTGSAIGAVAAQLRTDITNTQNSAFIQNQNGNQLSQSAYSWGITPQKGSIPAECVIINSALPGLPIALSAGEAFVSNFNGKTFVLQADTIISDSQPTPLSLLSQDTGAGLAVPLNSTFQNSQTDALNYIVTSTVDGFDSESTDAFRKRLLQSVQNPRGAGRPGDFIQWAFEAAPNEVTNVFTLTNFQDFLTTIGVFVLAGSNDYNAVLLEPGIPYDRTATPATVTAVKNYITSQAGIQQQFVVGSVSTYAVPDTIEIQVRLAEGLSLTSTVTNFNGDAISVEDIIIQEYRRSLITYPTGGTFNEDQSASQLLLSRIEATLDSSLSVSGGVYAQILLDRVILVNGMETDIDVPFSDLDSDGNLIAVYDYTLANTSVTLL